MSGCSLSFPAHPATGPTNTSPSKQKSGAGAFCVATVAAAAVRLGLGKTLILPERLRAPLPRGVSLAGCRLTRMLRFPLVNSLKASVTCSRVLVFLKSRFTEPSSF